MKRRIFHFFLALSLLLCLATIVLLVSSYRDRIALVWARHSTYLDVSGDSAGEEEGSGVGFNVAYGCVLFSYNDFPDFKFEGDHLVVVEPPRRRIDRWTFSFNRDPDPDAPPLPERIDNNSWLFRWGFWASFNWKPKDEHFVELETPLYLFVIVLAIAPTWWLWRKYRGRHRHGTCRACGYDLRATPERCPECGTARVAE